MFFFLEFFHLAENMARLTSRAAAIIEPTWSSLKIFVDFWSQLKTVFFVIIVWVGTVEP